MSILSFHNQYSILQKMIKIFSFQIDHEVVGPGGVFVIETKHWGKESISNRELFSPVQQIRRSGHALYILIKSGIDKGSINLHGSWGKRSVSVRKIIVFTASSVKRSNIQRFQIATEIDNKILIFPLLNECIILYSATHCGKTGSFDQPSPECKNFYIGGPRSRWCSTNCGGIVRTKKKRKLDKQRQML